MQGMCGATVYRLLAELCDTSPRTANGYVVDGSSATSMRQSIFCSYHLKVDSGSRTLRQFPLTPQKLYSNGIQPTVGGLSVSAVFSPVGARNRVVVAKVGSGWANQYLIVGGKTGSLLI